MHFSSFAFQLMQRSVCLSKDLSDILYSIDARRVIAMFILCESCRINNMALLQLGPCWKRRPEFIIDERFTSLNIESCKFEGWHSSLPQSELLVNPTSVLRPRDRVLPRTSFPVSRSRNELRILCLFPNRAMQDLLLQYAEFSWSI